MKKIILVDDDFVFRSDMVTLLPAQFSKSQAQGSPQALRLFKKGKPDLCLIDVRMPAFLNEDENLEGLYLAKEIEKLSKGKTPIILMSSFDLPHIPFELAFHTFLKKPFLISTLRNHIEHIFQADSEKRPNISA